MFIHSFSDDSAGLNINILLMNDKTEIFHFEMVIFKKDRIAKSGEIVNELIFCNNSYMKLYQNKPRISLLHLTNNCFILEYHICNDLLKKRIKIEQYLTLCMLHFNDKK
jgi:hypothetical protein